MVVPSPGMEGSQLAPMMSPGIVSVITSLENKGHTALASFGT